MFKMGLGQDIGIDLGTATVIAYVKKNASEEHLEI